LNPFGILVSAVNANTHCLRAVTAEGDTVCRHGAQKILDAVTTEEEAED
jgi:hypothetical protein